MLARAVLAAAFVVGCGRVNFETVTLDTDGPIAIGPRAPTRIAAGGKTTCVRKSTGVLCWGNGDDGKLGDGNPANHDAATPAAVMGTGPLVELDVNDPGAAGIDANGNVVGWGSNVFGSLASGHTGAQPVAVPMLGISNALTLTLAFDTACVVDAANAVQCAGNHLRLGDGSTVDRATLGAVPIGDVVQLSGGDSAVCALLRDGSVHCWGENKHGELGDGTLVDAPLPTTGPIGPYTTIAVGDTHVCALTVDRHVDCWGNNDSGELGDGTVTRSSTPVRVADVEDATALMLTAITSCALHGDGGVSCWGSNRNGELTIDPATPFRPTAERIQLTDVVELSGRTALHGCAIKRDDTIWCWGNNASSQLGRPASGAEPTPLQVPGVLAD